ncbi:uncharacterized protein CBL_01415 [Carabus blaptoides fortunei]
MACTLQKIHLGFPVIGSLDLKCSSSYWSNENSSLVVPWVIGFITFMALEAVSMVYSNVLRDHVNKVFAIYVVMRFCNMLRAGISWKGPERVMSGDTESEDSSLLVEYTSSSNSDSDLEHPSCSCLCQPGVCYTTTEDLKALILGCGLRGKRTACRIVSVLEHDRKSGEFR